MSGFVTTPHPPAYIPVEVCSAVGLPPGTDLDACARIYSVVQGQLEPIAQTIVGPDADPDPGRFARNHRLGAPVHGIIASLFQGSAAL